MIATNSFHEWDTHRVTSCPATHRHTRLPSLPSSCSSPSASRSSRRHHHHTARELESTALSPFIYHSGSTCAAHSLSTSTGVLVASPPHILLQPLLRQSMLLRLFHQRVRSEHPHYHHRPSQHLLLCQPCFCFAAACPHCRDHRTWLASMLPARLVDYVQQSNPPDCEGTTAI